MAKSKPKDEPAANPVETASPAEYTVVARRYRPKQFSDLIGQEHVAQALSNALTSGRVAHAFLFTGARGVGKTSSARILAKALNCEKGPTPTPCDACPICQSISDGDDVDVLEIDGASNNGVDNVRELRQNVSFRPQRARYKIYIIDEVHMLSTSAFNALLKTLEEPPGHVKFIFATTEVQKIPITILSRCQRFDFASINATRIFATLKHIVGKEGLKADDDALHIIARRAAGSMRDAQTLLDQLLGFANDGTLTAATVQSLLGSSGDDLIAELSQAILARDAKKALEQIDTVVTRGLQLAELLDQLIDYWRGMMLVKVAGPGYPDLPGTPALQKELVKQTQTVTLDTVLAGIDVLTTAKMKLKNSPNAQIVLEVAVVRLARLEELLSVPQLIQAVANGGSMTVASAPVSNNSDVKKNSLTPDSTSANVESHAESSPPSTFEALWAQVKQEIGPVRGGQLNAIELPAIIGPNALAIRFPAAYSSAYELCSNESGQTVLKKALKKFTGQDWTVRTELLKEIPTDVPKGPVAPATDLKKDLLKLPIFLRAARVLGAQLLKVEEGFNPQAAPVSVPVALPAVDSDDEIPTPETDEI